MAVMRDLGKITANWCRSMWAWLCEQPMFWLALGVLALAVACMVFWPAGTGEQRVVGTGVGLQLFGILSVWLGFERTRKEFEFELTIVAFWRWLRRIPWRGPRVHNVSIQVSGNAAMHVTGHATLTATTADPSLEARVDALQKNVEALRSELSATRSEFVQKIEELKTSHGRIAEDHSTRIEKVNRKLLIAQTGGLDLSLAGLVWLAVGVIATSIPAELAQWLGLVCDYS
jgi:hypothetical protein